MLCSFRTIFLFLSAASAPRRPPLLAGDVGRDHPEERPLIPIPAVTTPPTATRAAAPAGAGAVLARPGLVDGEGAALDLLAVEGGNRLVPATGHFNEPKPARTARLPVGGDLGTSDLAKRLEELAQVVGGGL